MNGKYRELVAIQVEFDKETAKYKMVHHYRLVTPEQKGGFMTLAGYDMVRQGTVKDITGSLRSAYEPAILAIWTKDETYHESEVLQLQPQADPIDLHLPGEWLPWPAE